MVDESNDEDELWSYYEDILKFNTNNRIPYMPDKLLLDRSTCWKGMREWKREANLLNACICCILCSSDSSTNRSNSIEILPQTFHFNVLEIDVWECLKRWIISFNWYQCWCIHYFCLFLSISLRNFLFYRK